MNNIDWLRKASFIILLCLSLPAQAAYQNSYFCPKYSGRISIGDGIIGIRFFDDYPPMGFVAGDRPLSSSRFEYDECKGGEFLCLSPKTPDGANFLWDMPIVAPQVINPGSTYHYLDMTIETSPQQMGLRKEVVRVVGRRGDGKSDQWFSLTIKNKVGVVDLHLSSIHAVRASTGEAIELNNVTCYLDSSRALFSGVQVRSRK